MSMPAAKHSFTADEIRAFPDDGNRYEVVHGELLVTPAPSGRHQVVIQRLVARLQEYLLPNGREELLCSPADISWDDDTLVQPDIFVGDFARFLQTFEWVDIRTLYLVIEVLSPSTRRADRGTKRQLYQERSIPQYWIVDIEQHCVDVWRPDADAAERAVGEIYWRHPLPQAACVVDLDGVFRGL
ncbi:MAG: Uma2 family endonuclease [Gemmatimonadales bacterium]